MAAWAIYYATVARGVSRALPPYTSDDGAWEDAPVDGVVCVVRRDGARVEFHSGEDYYRRFEDGSIGATRDLATWVRAGDIRRGEVKFGLFVSSRLHEEVMSRARSDWS